MRALIDMALTEMSARLDECATVVSEAIHDACELDDALYLSTRQSTRANLGLITTLLADRAPPTSFTAPEEALSYARSYVHEGLSFALLTQAYREGEHAYTRLWLEQLHGRAHDIDELAAALGYLSDYLFTYINTINRPLSDVYSAEHERWIRGGVAMRSEEVRTVLSGAKVDVAQSSSRLRYRLDGRHLGFVIWTELQEGDGVAAVQSHRTFDEMDRLAGEVAAALGASSFLALPIASSYAGWAAIGSASPPSELCMPTCPAGMRVALGRPGRGVDGFRRTHHEAMLAKRVASLSQRASTRCVDYGSLALDALLTSDLEEARRFVAAELGQLMEDSDASRRLAATLEVFLAEESSFVRAARRLGIHENTVAYRVRRAEELLGRRACERQLELRAALRLAHFIRADGDLR